MSRIDRPNITSPTFPGQFEQMKRHYTETIERLIFELNDLEKRLKSLEGGNNGEK